MRLMEALLAWWIAYRDRRAAEREKRAMNKARDGPG